MFFFFLFKLRKHTNYIIKIIFFFKYLKSVQCQILCSQSCFWPKLSIMKIFACFCHYLICLFITNILIESIYTNVLNIYIFFLIKKNYFEIGFLNGQVVALITIWMWFGHNNYGQILIFINSKTERIIFYSLFFRFWIFLWFI